MNYVRGYRFCPSTIFPLCFGIVELNIFYLLKILAIVIVPTVWYFLFSISLQHENIMNDFSTILYWNFALYYFRNSLISDIKNN